ncbi:uncharacterized protein LOC143027973 [Oratosquilla oratoria]|uniref:uncharacterized protein LOC143027973 n=1 Tax=Oratosquilla oratoria TaxID=337810 RepID=UPI003F75FCBB
MSGFAKFVSQKLTLSYLLSKSINFGRTLSDKEFFRVCSECGLKVCDDCASYSTSSAAGNQDKWNCSICRRRLSTRAKSDPAKEGATTPLGIAPSSFPSVVSTCIAPPTTPSSHATLSLVSGLASMASSLASQASLSSSTPTPIITPAPTITPAVTTTTTTLETQASTLATTTTTTTTITVTTTTLASSSSSSSSTCSTAISSTAASNGLGPRGTPCRKSSRRVHSKQRSLERTRSRDDSRDRRPSAVTHDMRPRHGEGARERPGVQPPRRRSDNEEDRPARLGAGNGGSRRSQRLSEHLLRDSSEEQLHLQGFHRIHAAHSETDVSSRSRKMGIHSPRPPLDAQGYLSSSKGSSEAPPLRSGPRRDSESSPDENLADDAEGEEWRRRGMGRRRSMIMRQKSYEEEDAEPPEENLWSIDLPSRRHSSQDPSRRDDSLEGRRTRDSLDVPQHGRVYRHHSWDYDMGRDHANSSIPVSVQVTGGSRFSSESDVSSEAASDRGSTNTLADDQRRWSRSSVKRRSSYRASKAKGRDPIDVYDPEDPDGVLESSSSPISPEIPPGVGGGYGGGQGSPRRSGTSSLEDDQWLHPTDDEWRACRRRSSQMSESGRVLPTPPASPRGPGMRPASATPLGASSSLERTPAAGAAVPAVPLVMRGTQSFESSPARPEGIEDGLRRQGSVTEGETIRIVINDVDLDHRKDPSKEAETRRVTIQRDVTDITHRTRGLGMRVVGGKVGQDGRLFAYVVWTVPGGPADAAGVCRGDKVLEWNGVSLTDRSFEEVSSIMDSLDQPDVVDLLLQSSNDLRSLDHGDDPRDVIHQRRRSADGRAPPPESEVDKAQSASARRKLPRIPNDLTRDPVSGKVQVQLWYDPDKSHLIATVVSAHDLRYRDSVTCCPPEPFVCLRLYPFSDNKTYSTGIAEGSCKPLWNSSFIWEGLASDGLPALTLELSLWDYVTEHEHGFLGETLIDLRHAYLDERPTWYRLHERRSRSASATPRGSVSSFDFSTPLPRRPSSVRSGSDDVYDGEDSRNSSLDSGLLHPDLAWREARSPSRRGSSLSEQAECEVYQLSRSYPHSLPQSRRSSVAFQSSSPELKAEELEARLSLSPVLDRRRTRSFRLASRSEGPECDDFSRPRPRVSSFSAPSRSALHRSHSLKSEDKGKTGNSCTLLFYLYQRLRQSSRAEMLTRKRPLTSSQTSVKLHQTQMTHYPNDTRHDNPTSFGLLSHYPDSAVVCTKRFYPAEGRVPG